MSPQIANFSDLVAGGLQVLFLSYGRDDERQADDLGYHYALAQFKRTYPSTAPLKELALINQLSGPDSVMPAKYPAKKD